MKRKKRVFLFSFTNRFFTNREFDKLKQISEIRESKKEKKREKSFNINQPLKSNFSSLAIHLVISTTMKLVSLLFVFTCLFLFLNQSVVIAQNFSSVELNALHALFISTNGTSWDWSSVSPQAYWNFSVPNPNPCLGWHGILCTNPECSSTYPCNVWSLALGSFNLEGFIPSEISNLTQLIQLNLDSNSLFGTIPSSLGGLTMLQYLSFKQNKLTGTIPAEIGNLSNLLYLDLYNNKLNGSIPSVVGNLTNLYSLDLSVNDLSSSIPSLLGNLVNLQKFVLSFNSLNGSIPYQLGGLGSNLQSLFLSSNYLTGKIPSSLGNLDSLLSLDLSSNSLSGTIPNELGGLVKLQSLSLEHNFFNGSIPYEFARLVKIQSFTLLNNTLTGSIPPEFGNMSMIQHFDVSYNSLYGSIPTTLRWWVNLNSFKVGFNLLSRSISSSIFSNISYLYYLDAANNQLTGSIPSEIVSSIIPLQLFLTRNFFNGSLSPAIIQKSSSLIGTVLNNNQLTGPIPDSFPANCILTLLNLKRNYFDGTVPLSLGNCGTSLGLFSISDNVLTGKPLETSFFDPLSHMGFLFLDNNLLSGSISPIKGVFPFLTWMNLSFNSFTGTIPKSISNFTQPLGFAFNNNKFTGSVGNIFTSPSLAMLYLMNNEFTGSLQDLFDVNVQSRLFQIDVSNNHFTGDVPEAFFTVPRLEVFIAAVNCLSASIPTTVCQSSHLQALVLDGLGSASGCRDTTRFSTDFGSSYSLKGSSTIPSCLFNLTKLQTLHLSGLGLTGSIPSDVIVSNAITDYDLCLSHNSLTGSIPGQLINSNRTWKNLDLSFNYFEGTLPSNVDVITENASLSLDINRLSGTIPSSYVFVVDISILNGNMFDCNGLNYENELPRFDPAFHSYECGSNSVNYSIIVWTGLIIIFVLAVLVYSLKYQLKYYTYWKILDEWWKAFIQQNEWAHLNQLAEVLQEAYLGLTCIMGYIIIVFIPVYGSLTVYSGSYTFQYVWTVSSAFLSGTTPAVTMFVFLVILLVFSFYLLRRLSIEKNLPESRYCDCSTHSVLWEKDKKIWFVFVLIILLDMVVVIFVNGAYVYAVYQQLSRSTLLLLKFSLALFKSVWGSIIVIQLFGNYFNSFLVTRFVSSFATDNLIQDKIESLVLNTLIFLSIFNNIVVPYGVSAFVNPNCFFYYFTTPPAVSTSYLTASTLSETFVDRFSVVMRNSGTISFQPSFTYSYSCTSTLLTNFVSVFIIRYIITGVVRPPSLYMLLWFRNQACVKSLGNWCLLNCCVSRCCLDWFDWAFMVNIPVLWKVDDKSLSEEFKNFNSEEDSAANEMRRFSLEGFTKKGYLVQFVGDLSVAFTFGVMFPPLFLIILFSMFVDMMDLQLSIGRLLCLSVDYLFVPNLVKRKISIINEEFRNFTEVLRYYLYCVLHISVCFWGLSLFDTLGDEVGAVQAIWIAVFLFLCPWLTDAVFLIAKAKEPIAVEWIWRTVSIGQRANSISRYSLETELNPMANSSDTPMSI
jgi:Leucine-rich repeat (LRR) protein